MAILSNSVPIGLLGLNFHHASLHVTATTTVTKLIHHEEISLNFFCFESNELNLKHLANNHFPRGDFSGSHIEMTMVFLRAMTKIDPFYQKLLWLLFIIIITTILGKGLLVKFLKRGLGQSCTYLCPLPLSFWMMDKVLKVEPPPGTVEELSY